MSNFNYSIQQTDSNYSHKRPSSNSQDDYYNKRKRRDDYYPPSSLDDPYKSDYLVSKQNFQDFINNSRSTSISSDELSKRYDIYKENFARKQHDKFFAKNKSLEWFKERYHPTESLDLKKQIHSRRLFLLEQYMLSIADSSNVLEKISMQDSSLPITSNTEESQESKENIIEDETLQNEKVAEKISDSMEDDTGEVDESADVMEIEKSQTSIPISNQDNSAHDERSKDLVAFAQNALFIKSIPENISRDTILQLCSKVNGFQYLFLTDPRIEKRMSRLGWIVFESGTDLDAVLKELDQAKIDDFVLLLARNQPSPIRTKTLSADFNDPERVKHDLEQIQSLAAILDNECGFESDSGFKLVVSNLESVISDEDETITNKNKLDLLIHYLIKVHQYDYYGGLETQCPEDMCRRMTLFLRPSATVVSKINLRSEASAKLDSRIHLRSTLPLEGGDMALAKIGGRSLERVMDQFLSSHIKKEAESKHRCLQCQKLFKGDEFIKKHLKTKHPEISNSVSVETFMFNAFIMDSGKLDPVRTSTAFSQRAPQKYASRDSRDNRDFRNSRDSRDNYRGRDGYSGNSRRYERSDRSGDRGEARAHPSKSSGRMDPRSIRNYQDLDAPSEADIELRYD